MQIGTGFSLVSKHFTMYPDKTNPGNEPLDNEESVPPAYEFSDEQLKEKIRKHLTDINDVISENDIKNAKVPGKEKTPTRRKRTKKSGTPRPPSTEGNPPTSWDVVN